MILEIARLEIKADKEAEFEAGMAKALPLFRDAKGCHGVAVRRSVEKPAQYWLLIRWETVDNHTRDFAGSADFQTFIGLVGSCFAAAPQVDHADETWTGF
jgi:heme-degrading monooxygenase HmoA